MRSPLHRMFRKAVFFAGDVRRLRSFPFVTWDTNEHLISLDEVLRDALPLLQYGDIILHRDGGFLSNLFIGGFMIHAGVFVGDNYVVEATSGGVVRRSAAYILHSDYAMILRPRFSGKAQALTAAAIAIKWAEKCVGCDYDELFDFNVAIERKAIELGLRDDVALACTEIPLLCYYDYVDQLGIKTRKNISALTRLLGWMGLNTGEEVVDADMYVRADFDIIWKSKSITPEVMKKMGCDEGYRSKLETVK